MAERQPPGELEIGRRALTDDSFRTALLKDPAGTLEREYGVRVPDGMRIQVHEETDQLIHLLIPGRGHSMGKGIGQGRDDTAITPSMRAETTKCCTCGSSTSQSMSSVQSGCGC